MDIKITKIKKLYEVNNCMAHNYYYLVNGRVYDNNHQYFKKFKFVLWYDDFDLQDYFDTENEEINEKEYRENNAYTIIESLIQDFNKCDDLIEYCNKTITDYNSLSKY